MTFDETLKAGIETATGYSAYALEKPLEKAVPATVYKFISDFALIAMDGDTGLRHARIQLTSVADTYAKMKSLIANTEDYLFANTTDFLVSLPLETKLEDKEDNLYYSIREYYIWYRSI